MGRIEDLKAQEEREAAGLPAAGADTATGVINATPPSVATATDTATPPAEIPAAETTGNVETVSKADYDQLADLLGKTTAECERLRAAYSTIDGKYKAEVPRLQAENKALKESGTTSQPAGGTISDDIARITEEYGDDIGKILKAQQMEIDRLKEQANTPPAAASVDPDALSAPSGEVKPQPTGSFVHDLTVAFPRWQFINGDKAHSLPAHEKWAPFLFANGKEKQYLLDAYVKDNNAAGAASIFKQFMDSLGNGSSASAKPSGDLKGLESFVDPATLTGGQTPNQGAEPILKMSDYRAFMRDRRLGRLSHMTQAELSAKEAEYDLADSEGRLR